MTPRSPESADGNGAPEAPGGRGGRAEALEQVREQALRLLGEMPRQPRALHVRAGDVAVDVEWADGKAADQPSAALAEPGQQPGGGPTPDQSALDEQEAAYLAAPTVGVFYRAPEPGEAPFVTEGDSVRVGQQVAIIEAMKLMVPVEADQAGQITRVLKENGEPVEYGERLFALEPATAEAAP